MKNEKLFFERRRAALVMERHSVPSLTIVPVNKSSSLILSEIDHSVTSQGLQFTPRFALQHCTGIRHFASLVHGWWKKQITRHEPTSPLV